MHVALSGARGMTFHQVHGIGAIGQPLKRTADGDLLGDAGGFHHAEMVVARSHVGDDGVNLRSARARNTFPFDNNHSSAFAENHPIAFSIEGA